MRRINGARLRNRKIVRNRRPIPQGAAGTTQTRRPLQRTTDRRIAILHNVFVASSFSAVQVQKSPGVCSLKWPAIARVEIH